MIDQIGKDRHKKHKKRKKSDHIFKDNKIDTEKEIFSLEDSLKENKLLSHSGIYEKQEEIKDFNIKEPAINHKEKLKIYNSTYKVDLELLNEKVALFKSLLKESEWDEFSNRDGIFVGNYKGNEDNLTGLFGSVTVNG